MSLLLGGFALSGCSAVSSSGSPTEPLLVVGYSGGLCVDGNTCESSFTVYQDGSSDAGENFDVTTVEKAITASSLSQRPRDPDSFCQSYVDGQDLIIQVPAWGATVYKPCELKDAELDPLTVQAMEIMRDISAD